MSDLITPFERDYNMSIADRESMEAELVEMAREEHGETITAIWVSSNSVYSNFIQTTEARYFPEVAELDESYDMSQDMFMLVDTRPEDPKILHATTVMEYAGTGRMQDRTGFYTVDSLAAKGNFTLDEFREYYMDQGVDLEKCLAVETNFKVHPKARRYERFFGSADLANIIVYQELLRRGAEIGSAVVFATVNDAQARSLDRTGIQIDKLMGRDKFNTEEADHGIKSSPIALVANRATADFFDSVQVELPEIRI